MTVYLYNTPTRFKANPQNINYNNHYTKPMPAQYNMDDMYTRMAIEQNKAEKRERSRENWNKAGVIFSGVNGVAFLTLAALAVLSAIWMKKGAKEALKDGTNKIKNEYDQMTTVSPNWLDFSKEKTVAALDSNTTAKSLKETFNNIINNSKLSEKAKKWGGSSDGNVDILYLYGHGGVGKTYVAKQYAQEIGALFTCIKYPDLGSPFKDAASMRISSLFDEIIKYAGENKDKKLVVCIDEIDAVMRKVPDGQHGAEEVSKSRAALLTGLDKLRDSCSNVTIIATSNYHPKSGTIDPIALRRFNNKIEVPLPKQEQIKALLEMYMKNIGAVSENKFTETSAFNNFARKLERGGYSNGEIELIAKEAGKIFSSTLKDVKDEQLKNHKFTVKYLEEALKMNGEASSKTNKLMDVKNSKDNSRGTSIKDLSWIQKIRLLFHKWE